MATYVVEPGDTLSWIARQHGTTAEAIRAANSGLVTDINRIQPGWKLTLPGGSTEPRVPERAVNQATSEYVVKTGDILGILAVEWGTTVAALVTLNNLSDPDVLSVGQRLLRPGGPSTSMDSHTGTETTDPTRPATTTVNVTPPPGTLLFTCLPLEMPPAVLNGGYLEDYGGYLHRGLDLGRVPVGTPIFAPAPGVVTVHRPADGTGFDSFGICVVIDHPGTIYWSIYAHMDSTHLVTGASVEAGDLIGHVGWTGKVIPASPDGAHLHWQISDNDWFPANVPSTRNPVAFLAPGLVILDRDDVPLAADESLALCAEDLAGPTPTRRNRRQATNGEPVVDVRPADEGDWEAILAVSNHAYPWGADGRNATWIAARKEAFDEGRLPAQYITLGANAVVNGYGAIEREDGPAAASRCRVFLVMDPGALATAGEALFELLVEDARSANCKTMWVRVEANDPTVTSFYANHGFVETSHFTTSTGLDIAVSELVLA
jgi:murein DD-endopeptidase MepM/ murein hydrolase activator NlpD